MPIFASRAGVIVTLYRGPRENRIVTAKEAQLAGRPPPAYMRMTHCHFRFCGGVYGLRLREDD